MFLARIAHGQLLHRTDLLVDPDAEGAAFVEIVPRENWAAIKLETATDLGFVRVDATRRALLFEGDKERYQHSRRAAITSCRSRAHGTARIRHDDLYDRGPRPDVGGDLGDPVLAPPLSHLPKSPRHVARRRPRRWRSRLHRSCPRTPKPRAEEHERLFHLASLKHTVQLFAACHRKAQQCQRARRRTSRSLRRHESFAWHRSTAGAPCM